jgi:polyphosphate kinase
LIPGLPKVSENIEAISIVDQYLEHSRVFIFYNNGREEVYFGSADLMTRNIDYRIEVIAPVLNVEIRQQLIDLMELQWQDNTKARIFDADQNNNFRTVEANQRKLRSQITARDYFLHLYQLTKSTEFEISSN